MFKMREWEGSLKGLQDLCAVLGNGLVGVEIGSYGGESSRVFAESGRFTCLYCVDPWKPELEKHHGTPAPEVEAAFDAVAAQFPCIRKMKMTDAEFFRQVKGPIADFAYIDASHDTESVKRDIRGCLAILKPDGIIAGHDFHDKRSCGVIPAVRELLGEPHHVFVDTSWLFDMRQVTGKG